MHILHIYKDYYPVVGGVENHVRVLAEAQAAAGHQVTVLTTNTSWRTQRMTLNDVQVIKCGRLAKFASTPLSLRLIAALAQLRPDLTHLHFPYPFGEVAQLLVGRSRYTVVMYHSDIVRQARLLRLYKPWLRRILAKADRIIATSPAYLASSPYLAEFAEKCRVIPLGIDLAAISRPDPAGAAALRVLAGSRPLVLFVGVLRYYKGLQYLIQALPQVPAHLLIVGDGPQKADLMALADQLGVRNRITFAGRVSDAALPACYQAGDCFVLPASERSEAFGLAQVEALANGLPVVSTELGTGTSYVNMDGISGLVVPPKDPAALAEALNHILGDDALRARLAQGARERAQLFNAERMMAQIQALYDELLTERR
ncbi:MAG: glycosyltransferase [Chloroflexi bacterium]|nr:glycosyltransferase [Chloroflexota bacterium]